jgi:hypothetical protein
MLTFPDRFWWLQRVVGILLVVGCFIAALYAAIQAYDTYNTSQIPGGDPINTALLRNLATQFLLLAGISALFVVQGILLILTSVEAQRRFRRRRRAIEGNQDAMLRARVKVDMHNAHVLSSEPLELLWRATSLNSGIMTTIFTISLMVLGSFTGLCLYLAYCLATNTPPIGSTRLEPMAPFERVGVVAVVVIVAAMLLFLIVFIIRLLPWERGRPYGVVASSDGLWYCPRGGKKRLLRWEEARLLEVGNKSYREYKLYSRNALAQWRELPPSSLVTLGLTKQEFWERHQALLNLIAARTHLLPRTFDKKLAEPDEDLLVTRRQDG